MSNPSYISNANPAFIEMLYSQYKTDPASVDLTWRKFFEGFEYGCGRADSATSTDEGFSDKEVKVMKLITAYRDRGHLIAKTNPIRPRRLHQSDLNLDYFGLTEDDLDTEFEVGNEIKIGRATLRAIIAHLEETYCASIGVEFRYSPNSQLRQWMHEAMESTGNRQCYTKAEKKKILEVLTRASGLESFIHKKYVGQKRFSLEGLEAVIPGLNAMFEEGARHGVSEFVMGMPHRGRLNVLTNLFNKEFSDLFSEFEGYQLHDEIGGDGDVKYHMGHSADVVTEDGHKLHLSLAANPSHLEAVNPVVMGRVRAKWDSHYKKDYSKIVPVILHGDAAIAGQGVVYECVNFAKLDGYSVGGTMHVVLNNQVGFTANYRESRSSLYCTDIAKVLESPVFHVNADDVEAVVHVFQMAMRLRQTFGCDVYIDVLGYRRYGHNEGDEPRFTQPQLYKAIGKHTGVLDLYSQQLIDKNHISQETVAEIVNDFNDHLQTELTEAREDADKKLHVNFLARQWEGYRKASQADFEYSIKTGVERTELDKVAKAITTCPTEIKILRKLSKMVAERGSKYFDKGIVDWGMAEHLAFGTLLNEGNSVRISGQDARRGTFSHRHAVLIDENDETEYIPLNHIPGAPEKFQGFNSHLAEYAVLGFDYGYSLSTPNGLTIWEAQFGDFANGAQIIFDQFISSSESKWQRMSGLVCLLPHGYEGQGPEHSSARLERWLSLAAENNMVVANPTTPANFYHLLRRQLKTEYRLPLICMTPKSLLRNPKCVSTVDELVDGKFQETIDDADFEKAGKKVERVLLCSGKIYYELQAKKEEGAYKNVAIVRIEQFYPTPKLQDQALAEKYASAKEWYWVQEEPRNMGGWYYFRARFDHLVKDLKVIARKKSASPAHGNNKQELAYQASLIEQAFDGIKSK